MTAASGSGGAALVALDSVAVSFGRREVLSNVDLAVGRGEIVTVIGPNGAGKSTLVRVAVGLLTPSAGTVRRTDGLRIGYMPQSLHVDRTLPLTVSRFVAMADRSAVERREHALEEAGVRYLALEQIHDISGGELRRVLLARALLREPQLLVLDEPTANLDVSGQGEFYALLKRIRQSRDCGILLVSHDLHLVMSATDRVVCLNRHVCCSGRPEAVSLHPEYLALFGPGISAAHGIYAHDHDHRHGVSGETVDTGAIAPPSDPHA